MSGDVKIKWDNILLEGDLSFLTSTNDLESDGGLETAVFISLFTDRRAKDDDILPDPRSDDKRGWWGDLAKPIEEGDQIGSRLWLLERSKTTENILTLGKTYIQESLQWMIDDLVADSIDVTTERQGTPGNDRFVFSATIKRGSETVLQVSIKYADKWEVQFNAI